MAKAKKIVKAKAPLKGKKPAIKKSATKNFTAKKPVTSKAAVKPSKAKPAKKIAVKKSTAQKPLKTATPRPMRLHGVPEQMRDAALKILDERQAEDIITFDLGGRSTMADYLIVASGRNARQLAAIAHYLGDAFDKLDVGRTKIEGLPEANWVLVDGGDVIIHLFLPEVRGFYKIEDIWNKRG